MKLRSLPVFLLALSGIFLLAGLSIPVAIVLDTQPSIMTYGLALFSFPVWFVGAWRVDLSPLHAVDACQRKCVFRIGMGSGWMGMTPY